MEILNKYWFWLVAAGLLCAILERIFTWRKSQKMLRPQLWQDIVFIAINGHFFGLGFAYLTAWSVEYTLKFFGLLHLSDPHKANLLSGMPLVWQFILFIIIKDFLEWCVHILLHRVNFLWNFHKLHHSIIQMDWIGNFRFHWMEIIVYRSLTWLPLVVLGVDYRVIIPMAAVTTLIGDLNHSNIKISWGPLVYLINSSRMHIWHHDKVCHFKYGQNFAIVFSCWDWIFKTAYLPKDVEQPKQLGFNGMEKFPLQNPLKYMLWPLIGK